MIITQLKEGSVAAMAGIRPGTIIQEVNRTAVRNAREFLQAVAKSPKGDAILLLIREDRCSRFVALKVE